MTTRIISIQQPTEFIDALKFQVYRYATPEHEPIKLSNGMWLHTFKVTLNEEQEQDFIETEI